MGVPEEVSRDNAHETTFVIMQDTGMLESIGTCLLQEMARFNLLLRTLRSSLNSLKRAIGGFIVMNNDLDDMFQACLNNKVPNMWTKKAYPSLRPLASWYTDMIARVEFLHDWVQNGKPFAYWISAMYFPQGFLTSVLQAYARFNKMPV